ncbi:MAG TPA: N-acetylmuramoyl-L-alanine amidase [Brevibacterium sp.]|nr:N-acetylmuramoyl-L-alanine amidase [Brevibacterium sp.]
MAPGQFQTTITDLTTNDDGRRSGAPRVLVVHTFEGQDLPVERMTDYQSGRLPHQRTGSYHVVIDADGRSGRENDNEFIPWAAGWTGNRIGLHVSLAGRAAFTRAQWLARGDQLAELARWLAHESKLNDIPLEVVPVAGIRGNGRGVGSHADIARAYPHETDHTDPGPEFPWDYVLELARSGGSTTNNPPREADVMNGHQAHQLDDVTGQITGSPAPGEFPGWPQLGDRTLVDAVAKIGHALDLDGFLDPDGL